MLNKIYTLLLLATGSLLLASCEKVIDVDIKTPPNQLVIEGNITDQLDLQTIKITQSVPYTDSNVYPPVQNADVSVTTNDGVVLHFKESTPGNYTFGPYKGIPGKTYTLRVVIETAIYTASSTMPAPVRADSLSIVNLKFGSSLRKIVAVHYQDPETTTNQYRFIMKVNNTLTRRVYADNDRLTNGNNVKEQLFYGSDDDNEELDTNDEVEVEMQCIDNDIFKYWYTLSQQTQNGPGGGVTPGNPPSNINNNSLGYFSAHTTQTKTITVQ
ncbi:hypothetical protein GCM10023149_13150 [Mucilaginibacter gynuensis]|uniref:DUF4249 domain-containing protein n=1 Tax=Mucilaginibacter gynuensis TaxID=1302236 RepID=A0ABP8G334_9SPHI